MSEIDDEATNTMIMLDVEVRKKIRAELMDIVMNPQTDDERNFGKQLIHSARQMEQMEQMRQMQVYAARQSAYQNSLVSTQSVRSWNDDVRPSLTRINEQSGIRGTQVDRVWTDEAPTEGSFASQIFGKVFGK